MPVDLEWILSVMVQDVPFNRHLGMLVAEGRGVYNIHRGSPLPRRHAG